MADQTMADQTIDITTMTLIELKALAFDKVALIEQVRQESETIIKDNQRQLAIIQKQMGEVIKCTNTDAK